MDSIEKENIDKKEKRRIYQREYQRKNREKYKEYYENYHKTYYDTKIKGDKNGEKYKTYSENSRNYYKKNRDKILERNRIKNMLYIEVNKLGVEKLPELVKLLSV